MYCRVCVTPENFHTFWRFGNPKTLFSEIQTIPSFLSDRTFVEVDSPVKEYEKNHQNMDCVVDEYRDCVLLIGDIFQGNRKSKNISGKSKAQTIDLSPHCILSMNFTLSKSGRLWLLQRDISISDPVAAFRFFPPRPCSWVTLQQVLRKKSINGCILLLRGTNAMGLNRFHTWKFQLCLKYLVWIVDQWYINTYHAYEVMFIALNCQYQANEGWS